MISQEAALNAGPELQRAFLDKLGVYYPEEAKDTMIRALVRGKAKRVYKTELPGLDFSHEAKLLSGKEIYASIAIECGSLDIAFDNIGMSYEEAKNPEYLIVFAFVYASNCDALKFYQACVPKLTNEIATLQGQDALMLLDGIETGLTKFTMHSSEKSDPRYVLIKNRRALCDRYFKVIRLKEKAQQILDKVHDFASPDNEAFLQVIDFDVSELLKFKNLLL